jgi:hypothetical protein
MGVSKIAGAHVSSRLWISTYIFVIKHRNIIWVIKLFWDKNVKFLISTLTREKQFQASTALILLHREPGASTADLETKWFP